MLTLKTLTTFWPEYLHSLNLYHRCTFLEKDTDDILTDGTLASSQGGWWFEIKVEYVSLKNVILDIKAENNSGDRIQF